MAVSVHQLTHSETEIAVLQIQFKNLDEKVDDLRTDLKDMRDDMKRQTESTHELIKNFQDSNMSSHKDMSTKISALEKWRWMLMGAGIVIGSLGFDTIAKLLK